MARVRRRAASGRHRRRRTKHFAPQHGDHSERGGNATHEVSMRMSSLGRFQARAGQPSGQKETSQSVRNLTSQHAKKFAEVDHSLEQDAEHNLTLGLYVPAAIACMVYAQNEATKARRAEAVMKKDMENEQKNRALLMKAYPNIPTGDLLRILSHAFMKGSRRVGRSSTVRGGELVKMRLAVEAHIRHIHTQYDSLLRSKVPRNMAREIVGREVRRIRDEWAGLLQKSNGNKKEKHNTPDVAGKPPEPEFIVIDSSSSDLEILT
ncbi:hypothetical protein KEM54_004003 [Ascosphaera aggregata]|nr:hypothetical protein KEM54_004003 [Ascosphaera aggregata]